MKISFDLDGTLFGVFGPYLVNVYDDYLARGFEVGILTGRCMVNPVEKIQEEVKRIGVPKWDFWYDATMMNGLEKVLLRSPIEGRNIDILSVPPEQRIAVHIFKNRVIKEKEIGLHFDDEAKFMLVQDPAVPVFDIMEWGGEVGVNRADIRV